MTLRLLETTKSRCSAMSVVDRSKVLVWLLNFDPDSHSVGDHLKKVKKTKDLWSARIDDDLRAILARDEKGWLVPYIGRHDEAYNWAETRTVCCKNGEVVFEVSPDVFTEPAPTTVGVPRPHPILADSDLSQPGVAAWGLSAEVLAALRSITDEVDLLEFLTQFPEDVAEGVLRLACGQPAEASADSAPACEADSETVVVPSQLDIRRTFQIVDSSEDFLRAVDQPSAIWIAFLHPTQRRVAYSDFSGPVKVSGSAGTGKTVVALHRARYLARQGKRVLLTSFADTLCANLQEQLNLLCTPDELRLIRVSTVYEEALRLLADSGQTLRPDREGHTERWLKEIADYSDYARSPEWYVMEWEHVVHANGIRSLDSYLEVSRAGRGSPLRETERRLVWKTFEQLFAKVEHAGITDWATICMRAREGLEGGTIISSVEAVVVDEMQDLRPQELRFLSVLGGSGRNGLMLVGDARQRIFVPRFSLKSAGIDVVGRAHCLRVNYRTTQQIKDFAERVIPGPTGRSGVDGALSVRRGPGPVFHEYIDEASEATAVSETIVKLLTMSEIAPEDVAVFARQASRLEAVEQALVQHGVSTCRLSRQIPPAGQVRIGAMQRAKGLEFKAVFVVGASAAELPDPTMISHLFEPAAREEALERERQMLYVALTRARDNLWVTWTGEPSALLPERLLSPTAS